MTDVRVSESIAAPAATVWELLGDFGGVAKWGGSMLQSCKVEGEGVGAVRRLVAEAEPRDREIGMQLHGIRSAGRATCALSR